jgi:hypothetical protein
MVLLTHLQRLCFAVFALLVAPSLAAAKEQQHQTAQHPLAGWWISADDHWPKAWAEGLIIPNDELLIIKPDGSFENRLMHFLPVGPEVCEGPSSVCGDTVLASNGMMASGASRSFATIVPSDKTLATPQTDPDVRPLLLTAVNDWSHALDRTGKQLTFTRITQGAKAKREVRVLRCPSPKPRYWPIAG